MYQEFFQLQQMPFALTPNTQLYFNRHSHREALNTLLVALRHSEGFVKIVGEVGTGKTILCRKLLSCLGENFVTAYIPNPNLTSAELKSLFVEEIGIEADPSIPPYKLLGLAYRRLIQLAREGKQVVLVIDEAQAMPKETLETLRLLTNLETDKRKLLQVVLLGQPELDNLLAGSDLRQLRQRIVFSERLQPFTVNEVRNYLRFRLAAAGAEKNPFTASAMTLLAYASGGTARVINILAHKAMMSAFGRGDHKITSFHIARAITDTEDSRWLGRLLALRWRLFWPLVASASFFIVVISMHTRELW